MDARKGRALLERLYLLEAKRISNHSWSFVVRGSTGKIYDVVLSETKVSCSCFDCKQRRRICKHIYFIIGRIAQNKDLLVQMGDNLNVNVFELDPSLSLKISNRIWPSENSLPSTTDESNSSDAERDNTCSICYEDVTIEPLGGNGSQHSKTNCKSCKNVFHTDCIRIWTNRNPTCPMCRTAWIDKRSDSTDELVYLVRNTHLS